MDIPTTQPRPEDVLRAEALLHAAPVAFVSVVAVDAPYVIPMNFAYLPPLPDTDYSGQADAHAGTPGPLGQIVLHSGAGRKTRALADNPRVCMAVISDAAFVQGKTPCRHGFAYRSVLVEGHATLLEDSDRREQALRKLAAKYHEATADEPLEEGALAQTIVYSIEIDMLAYRERPRPT